MQEKTFNHDLGAQVRMIQSEEQGRVIGRAEFDHSEPTYLVRYRAADGCQRESWWAQSAVAAP
jgi:hypothetical protein